MKGCPAGPGNPYVRQVARLKAALYQALTEDDIRAVAQKLRDKALAGDVAAARLLLDYALGKPLPGALASALDAEEAERLSREELARYTDEELELMARAAYIAERRGKAARCGEGVAGDGQAGA
jgi:hypothetical protein